MLLFASFRKLFKDNGFFSPWLLLKEYSSSPVDLSYKVHGNELSPGSIPIIVMHGLLGSKKNWASVSKSLAEKTGRTVIAVDMRNHGESPHSDSHSYGDLAGDVEHLMGRLSISKTVLIGHSMGGRSAMVFSLTKPEKVAGLIVVDITPATTARALTSNYFVTLLDVMKGIPFDKVSSIAEARKIAKESLKKATQSEDTINFIVLNLYSSSDKQIRWRINVDTLKAFYRSDIATFPSYVSGKTYSGATLFIGGTDSDFMPSSDMPKIKEYFPTAEIKFIDGAGHNVHADRPAEFTAMAAEFVSKI